MSEEGPNAPERDGNYLDTVINLIGERNSLKRNQQDQSSSLNKLYGRADDIISQLDTSINRCKKYNEAKINRKYEIIIHDLQQEIERLRDSLKLEQDARSPTKKHVSDILEKLVSYRAENERFKKEVENLKFQLGETQDQLEAQTSAFQKIQNQQTKSSIERLPSINSSNNLAESIKQYLKDKEHVRKITKNSISSLQKLLHHLKPKLWNWSICNLLEEVDKWAEGIHAKPEVDMWRIRSSIARKFSDYMDDPQNLIKPSVSMKSRSQRENWQAKMSLLGSRQLLNASFH